MKVVQQRPIPIALRRLSARALFLYDDELYMVLREDPDKHECMLVYPMFRGTEPEIQAWDWHAEVIRVEGTLQWQEER